MSVTSDVAILEYKADLYDARQAVAQARCRLAMANRYHWPEERKAEVKDALVIAQKMLASVRKPLA